MAIPILAPSVAHDEPPKRVTGIRVVPGSMVQLPGHITPHDEAVIDFDVHAVEGTGLYALELLEAGRVVWSGCRAFGRDTSGAVFLQEDGARHPVEAIQGLADWRVAGKVVEIVPNAAGAAGQWRFA